MRDYACDKCGTIVALESPPASPFQCDCCQGKPWTEPYPQEKYDPDQHLVENRPSGIGLG